METSSTEKFTKALHYFLLDNFNSALDLFTELANAQPDNKSYSIYSITCLNKLKSFDKALELINKIEPSIQQPFPFAFLLQKGITLFNLEKYVDAKIAFTSALKLPLTSSQQSILTPWINKSNIELQEIGVYDYNAQAPKEIKVISNFMQTPTQISAELTTNQNLSNGYDVVIENKCIKIVSKVDKEVKYTLKLTNGIVPNESSFKIMGTKIKLDLKKEVPNFNWVQLEYKGNAEVNDNKSKVTHGFYPTSSKVKKDWDKLDKELDDEFKADAKADGNEGMWTLFRQIYERSDEKTRRAMIKSFQTSGGTVLSTNWDEVKDKDYEGKDRPEAPKGQEWRTHES